METTYHRAYSEIYAHGTALIIGCYFGKENTDFPNLYWLKFITSKICEEKRWRLKPCSRTSPSISQNKFFTEGPTCHSDFLFFVSITGYDYFGIDPGV
jgi:hypothetical protein